MKVPFTWLREFVDYDGSPWELSEILTMGGLEVESVDVVGEEFSQIVVGEVLSVDKHPNADKLFVCKVDVGDEVLDIVCGAPNVRKGIKVPVARPGVTIPNGLKIKKAKIRGVYSYGMILSGEEMGIEESSEGIYELDESAEVGKPLTEVLPVRDEVLDISVTPNRGDCLSIYGVAREVSALTGSSLRVPDTELGEVSQKKIDDDFFVRIEDPEGCFRYVAMAIEGTRPSPSPLIMRRRLEMCGMRAINSVVDVTNYVMLELGQPLHAFDRDLLRGGIIVRRARPGESIVTLDGIKRNLSESDLLICDESSPVAIAGVMGGKNSEVGDETETVLIESACFNPTYVRRTSKNLGLDTEASYRFSRGVDPGMTLLAAKRAISMIQKISGGRVLKGYIDKKGKEIKRNSIFVSVERLEGFLGLPLTKSEVLHILSSLGFSVEEREKGILCVPPSWRCYDVSAFEDVAEEVARVKGFDKVHVELPRFPSIPSSEGRFFKRRKIRRFFSSLGLSELVSYSFAKRDYLQIFWDKELLPLLNPLSEEMAFLRPLIVSSLVFAMARNQRFGRKIHRYFEVRKVFRRAGGEILEEEHVAILLSGRRFSSSFHGEDLDFFDLKGIVEEFFENFHIEGVSFTPFSFPFFVPGVSAKLEKDGKFLGFLGEISPRVKAAFGIEEGNVFVSEIDLEPIYPELDASLRYKPYSKFPVSWMDLSLVVPDSFYVGDLFEEIEEVSEKLKISGFDLVDVYKGPPIPDGKKSITLRVFYSDMRKTLRDEEVLKLHSLLVEHLKAKLNVELR